MTAVALSPGAISILLVDDHRENVLALEAVLKDIGYNLVAAFSGQEALKRVLNEDFAVILLDVRMPGMDGFETAELIRGRERSSHTPIIFMTAVSQGDAFTDKAYAVGGVDYIFKPFVPEILRAKVSVFVELYRKTAQLEAANKELDSFSYSIAHDLRAPLRKLDGFSDILQSGYGGKLDDEGRRLISIIRSNCEHMGQLIDDLLAFALLGRNELMRTDVDMTALAELIVDDALRQEPGRAVAVRVLPLAFARGDRAMLRQVFFNVVSNALKFTNRRPRAEVEIGSRASDDGRETIYYIRDNGAGFDMKYADKLFGVFSRLHTADEFNGTGIGLALVARIIKRHGGRVWAEAAVDVGATLFFTLPRTETHV